MKRDKTEELQAAAEIPKNTLKYITSPSQKENGIPYAAKPFRMFLEKGRIYTWCLCGQSRTQVYFFANKKITVVIFKVFLTSIFFIIIYQFHSLYVMQHIDSICGTLNYDLSDSKSMNPKNIGYVVANRRRIAHFATVRIDRLKFKNHVNINSIVLVNYTSV